MQKYTREEIVEAFNNYEEENWTGWEKEEHEMFLLTMRKVLIELTGKP